MSFRSPVSPRRRAYSRLIGDIANALHSALEDEGKRRGLTKSVMAEKFGTHTSIITRLFAGTANMTLESLSDLAFAMDRSVEISLVPKEVSSVPGNMPRPTVTSVSSGPQLASAPISLTRPVAELAYD